MRRSGSSGRRVWLVPALTMAAGAPLAVCRPGGATGRRWPPETRRPAATSSALSKAPGFPPSRGLT
jgi:hypothetical protein